MIERAAKIWEVSAEDVEYQDGVIQHTSDPELKLTFKQMAARQIPTGGPIVGSAGDGADQSLQVLDAYHPLVDETTSPEESMARAASLLERKTAQVMHDRR